jgi:predicted secreted protein
MSFLSGVAIYFIIWWLVLFTTLPFGVRRQESVEEGNDPGAPENPFIGRKLIATTLIAGVVFVIVYWVIASGMVDFHDS